MEKVLFKEEQRLKSWFKWLVITLFILGIIIPVGFGMSQEDAISDEGLVVVGIFSVIMTAFIFFFLIRSRLETKITNEGIWVVYPPIMSKGKKYPIDEIVRFEVRGYKANREFGGHGMKRRKKNGKSFTIHGNIGLQLYFTNGKKLLIGTQKKQAIEYAMNKLMQTEKIG